MQYPSTGGSLENAAGFYILYSFMNKQQFILELRSSNYLMVNKTLVKKYGLVYAFIISNYIEKYWYWKNRLGKNFNEWFYLRYADQTNEIGLGEDTLRKYRNKAVKTGIIQVKKEGLPAKTYYHIDFEALFDDVYSNPGLVPEKVGYSTPKTSGTLYNNKNKEKKNKPLSRGSGVYNSPIYDSNILFEIFWEHYPRKTVKGQARTAWEKLCKKRKDKKPSINQIIQTINLQKQTKQWQNPKYIPHASTWLNQSRWLDEIEEMDMIDKYRDKTPSNRTGTGTIKYKTPKKIEL